MPMALTTNMPRKRLLAVARHRARRRSGRSPPAWRRCRSRSRRSGPAPCPRAAAPAGGRPWRRDGRRRRCRRAGPAGCTSAHSSVVKAMPSQRTMPQASASAIMPVGPSRASSQGSTSIRHDLDGDAHAPQQADGDVVDAGGAPGQRAEAVEHGVARLAESGRDHEQQERPRAQQVGDAEGGVFGLVAGLRLRRRRQPKRQRHQHHNSDEADIEHP